MRKATWKDRHTVIDIFSNSFKNNIGTTWVLRKNLSVEKGIKRLAMYAFIKGYVREGVFLSDNEKGVAICYKFNYKVFSLLEVWSNIVLGITAISIQRLPKILSIGAYRKNIRPQSGEYLYGWFLGVNPGGETAALELSLGILKLGDELNLPVYIDTAVEKAKPVYERYGFETFHYWEDKKKGIQYWFLKREPHTSMSPRRV